MSAAGGALERGGHVRSRGSGGPGRSGERSKGGAVDIDGALMDREDSPAATGPTPQHERRKEVGMQVGLRAPQGWKGEYDGWQPADARTV